MVHRLGLARSVWKGDRLTEAPEEAARDERVRTHVDKLAVVIAPSTGDTYIIRLRHDAYKSSPERDPDPGAGEQDLRARTTTRETLKSGEVVKINDVHRGAVEVYSTAWGSRAVSKAELDYAMSVGLVL